MERKPIPPPKCAGCGKQLERVWISTYTTQIWKGDGDIGHYEEDPKSGDAEERCPHCERKYPLENEKTGVVSCFDVQKKRRRDKNGTNIKKD